VFKTQSSRDEGTICCFHAGSASSGVIKPSRVNIKFHSDHLYYTGGQMEALRAQVYSEQGLSYLYEDQIMTLSQIPGLAVDPPLGTVTEQRIERDIAVAGRVVRSMMVTEKFTSLADNKGFRVLGEYVSNALKTDTSYNWRINEQRIYDRDVSKPPHKFNELSQVLAMPLQVPTQFYSFDSDSNKTVVDRALNQNSVFIGTIEGHAMPAADNTNAGNDIRGSSHYLGIDLTNSGQNTLGNGKKIGSKPIVLSKTLQRTNGEHHAREIRTYAMVEKLLTVIRGKVMVSA
jgi:hypothetical protein